VSETGEALEVALIGGDLKKLSPEDRIRFYRMRCEAAGLDPRAAPFQYLELQGRLTLYATKAATDQLAARHALNVEIISRGVCEDGTYEVVARVRDQAGRITEELAAVPIEGLRGDLLCNAKMKAVTKAKRRAVLAHCGLGMPDETETETIPGAERVHVTEQGEIIGPARLPEPRERDLAYWRSRCQATAHDLHLRLFPDSIHHGDDYKRWCRQVIGDALRRTVETRTVLTLEEWRRAYDHFDALVDAWEAANAEGQAEGQAEAGDEEAGYGGAFGEAEGGDDYQPSPTLPVVENAEDGSYSAVTITDPNRGGAGLAQRHGL